MHYCSWAKGALGIDDSVLLDRWAAAIKWIRPCPQGGTDSKDVVILFPQGLLEVSSGPGGPACEKPRPQHTVGSSGLSEKRAAAAWGPGCAAVLFTL